MGNDRAVKVLSGREKARALLAAKAAEFEARQAKVEAAVTDVLRVAERVESRRVRRDERLASLRAKFDADCAKSRESYDSEAAKLSGESDAAVRVLLDLGTSVADIGELTGLSVADVREARARSTSATSTPNGGGAAHAVDDSGDNFAAAS